MKSSEEVGDLLLNISEESDSEISDYYIEEKILHLLENDKSNDKTWKDSVILITSSLFLFMSSTTLLIALPVYIEHSNRCAIDVYSKIVTLTTFNVVLFAVICALNRWLKRILSPPKSTSRLYMCLPKVFKISFLLTIASLLVFYLINEELVSCHLQDPIKGCVVVFSFLFYFIFSKRKTSVERVFCCITVIVGSFITVDFGLCDRYRCRGNENVMVNGSYTTYHVLFVIGYIVALAAFTLHFTCLENCFRSFNCSSSMDLSIVSSRERLAPPSPIAQSLSIISGGGTSSQRRLREPLNVSVPITNADSKCKLPFPMTSTPNEGTAERVLVLDYCDWLAAHHAALWLIVALFAWLPAIQLFNKEPKSIVAIYNDVLSSFVGHVGVGGGGGGCYGLWLPSTIVVASYLIFCISSLILLSVTHSALTVICVTVNALPMASLFWSVYQLDPQSPELVVFNMSVTGESISAMLGFPIVAVGTLIILKSHVLHPALYLRLH